VTDDQLAAAARDVASQAGAVLLVEPAGTGR